MNSNAMDMTFEIKKINAMMAAFESAYLDIEVVPEEAKKADNAVYAFYAIWEMLQSLEKKIEAKEDYDPFFED